MTCSAKLDEFPLQVPFRPGADGLGIEPALQKALKLPKGHSLKSGGLSCRGDTRKAVRLGIRFTKTRKVKRVEVVEFEFVYADARGEIVAWCSALESSGLRAVKAASLSEWDEAAFETVPLSDAAREVIGGNGVTSSNSDKGKTAGARRLRHETEVLLVAATTDGKYIASVANDGELVLWDAAAAVELGRTRVAKANHNIQSLAFSADGTRLVTGAGAVTLFSVPALVKVGGAAHPGRYDATACTFSRAGGLASCNEVQVVSWDPQNGSVKSKLKLDGVALAFSVKGNRLFVLSSAHLAVVDVKSMKVIGGCELEEPAVVKSFSGASVAVGGREAYVTGNSSIAVVDLATLTVVRQFGLDDKSFACALSPDEKALAVTNHRDVRVLSVKDGAVKARLKAPLEPGEQIRSLAWPTQDRIIAGADVIVARWSLSSGKLLA